MSIAHNFKLTYTHVHRYTDHSLAELAEMLLSCHEMGRWGILEHNSTLCKKFTIMELKNKKMDLEIFSPRITFKRPFEVLFLCITLVF